MSERLALLKPLLTSAVRKLAHHRLLTDEPLVNAKGVPSGKRADVKIALLLVQILNPYELFEKEEEALLRGTSSDTLLRRTKELKKL